MARRLTKQETEEMHVITDKLFDVLHGHELRCVIWVLAQSLALLWCENTKLETVTEALDVWRHGPAEDIESFIRKNFGEVRYRDRENRKS